MTLRVFTGVPGEPHVSGSERARSRRGAYVSKRVQHEILADDPEVRERHRRTVLRSSPFRHVSHRLRSIQ